MDAVHATWVDGRLRLWVESFARFVDDEAAGHDDEHPFARDPASALGYLGIDLGSAKPIEVLLPSRDGRPLPSPELAHAAGRAADPDAGSEPPFLERYSVLSVSPRAEDISALLERLLDEAEHDDSADDHSTGGVATAAHVLVGSSVRGFAVVSRVARHLLAQQRFVPMIMHEPGGAMSAGWRPWLSDEQQAERVLKLARSLPASARASAKESEQDAMAVVEAFLGSIIDSTARSVLRAESMMEALEAGKDRAGADDPHLLWLGGLLGEESSLTATTMLQSEMIKSVRGWIGALDLRGQTSAWRLGVRVEEPIDIGLGGDADDPTENEMNWLLRFQLRSAEDPKISIEAEDLWLLPAEGTTIEGKRLDNPHELLLAELGRASRICPAFEEALAEAEPSMLFMPTLKAYEFLREHRPLLEEQGVSVQVPEWWESPAMRLGTRLRIDSGPPGEDEMGSAGDGASSAKLGLGTLVNYHWEIAVGDKTLSLHEFEQLANRNTPLVLFGGKWVEIRPEDVNAALEFIRENPGGQMAFGEAMRLAYATDTRKTGVPVLGLEIGGWLSALLEQSGMGQKLPDVELPPTFHGTLRPYQLRGVSWLAFLERFGFGACLADDMGLGKTVQLLALLAYERAIAKQTTEHADAVPENQVLEPVDAEHELVLPTLLVVPMSVVGNWLREAERFCPSLNVVVHHGPERFSGDALVAQCEASDVVVTTYALANRDKETIERVKWRRIVLDEAQFIKNPQAKQSQAVRSLVAERRIALTGTPVENRLSELWSIMDFLNPGYLGTAGNFQRRFSVPIERYRDKPRGEQLRSLIGPFVLRRVKTDPTIIADLPEKIETREFSHLTREQAELYENTVKRVLAEVEQTQGMHRRGMVLSALIRLKQICNHPAQALRDGVTGTPPDPSRSGKCVRLLEMLDEVVAAGDRALIFTQFRQMGQILSVMLRHELGKEVLFLHGGTTQKQRVAMIDQFQAETSRIPIMLLSLKAGGVGLNLTAANHVFHFDRWWNPAVENQATDRAFRIGQTRTVHVHKFVVRGTLEERIDEMIEQKTELAESIVGSGERWLTDLSSDDLKRILTLRQDAVADDA